MSRWTRTCSMVLAGVLCLCVVGCGGSGGGNGSGEAPGGLVSFDGGSDGQGGLPADIGGQGGSEEPQEPSGDGGQTASDADSSEYGEAPTQPTSSLSPRKGDVSKIPALEVPSGVGVSADEVRQAIADVAPDVRFPSEVSVSKVDRRSTETSKGQVETFTWRYSFGKGDAVVVAQVQARVSDYAAADIVASVDSLLSASFDKADKSNVTSTRVDSIGKDISLSGGSIKCAAVSDGVYGVEIGFVADGKNLDASGALPTLTINGVTLVPQRREGNSTTHDGSERASFCYSGDIPCADGNVSVEWCIGKSSENGRDFVAASTSNMGARISFGSGTDDDIALSVAKAISGRVALCHMSAQEAVGSAS